MRRRYDARLIAPLVQSWRREEKKKKKVRTIKKAKCSQEIKSPKKLKISPQLVFDRQSCPSASTAFYLLFNCSKFHFGLTFVPSNGTEKKKNNPFNLFRTKVSLCVRRRCLHAETGKRKTARSAVTCTRVPQNATDTWLLFVCLFGKGGKFYSACPKIKSFETHLKLRLIHVAGFPFAVGRLFLLCCVLVLLFIVHLSKHFAKPLFLKTLYKQS